MGARMNYAEEGIYQASLSAGNGGATICTSSTRPAIPTTGAIIYETDTTRTYIWSGSSWLQVIGTGNMTGDVTSVGLATTITALPDSKLATIGTAGKVSNSATTATNANTASAIVARDASGNFTAGTITAALTGNASTATALIVNSVVTAPIETYATRGAMTGTVTYDVKTQAVLWSNANATANWTLNIRGDGSTALNAVLAIGQAITITLIAQQTTAAFYQSATQVDGTAVTPKWSGGTAPTAGNASANDVYTLTILKTASATFTILASLTKWGL